MPKWVANRVQFYFIQPFFVPIVPSLRASVPKIMITSWLVSCASSYYDWETFLLLALTPISPLCWLRINRVSSPLWSSMEPFHHSSLPPHCADDHYLATLRSSSSSWASGSPSASPSSSAHLIFFINRVLIFTIHHKTKGRLDVPLFWPFFPQNPGARMICPIGGNLCKSNCVARSSSADQGRSAQCSVLLPNPDLNLSSGRTFNPSPHNTSQRLRQSLLTWDEGSKPVTTTIPVPGVTTHIPLHKLSPPRTPPSPSPPTPLTLSFPLWPWWSRG